MAGRQGNAVIPVLVYGPSVQNLNFYYPKLYNEIK